MAEEVNAWKPGDEVDTQGTTHPDTIYGQHNTTPPCVHVPDPKWSVDPSKHKPDKEKTWTYPREEDGWTHAHNSLRGEIDTFGEALQATVERCNLGEKPLAGWEVGCIQRWWSSHFEHIHAHHHNEDEKFVPFFQKRFNYPPKLEADHVTLIEHLDKIASLVAGLDSTEGLGKLVKSWDEYDKMLKPHFLEEEAFVLPLMRAYFLHEEYAKLVQDILSNPKAPKEEMGAFIHFMGEEKFRSGFMKQEGIPCFVWWVGGFASKTEYYRAEVVTQVDALKSGTPPSPPRAACECSVM
jgi:hypothetical protein